LSPLRRAAYILCAATWLASGCATPPGLIAPADVSADKYATWPCDRIVERWNQLATALAEAEDVQARQAVKDAALLTLIIIIGGAMARGGGGGGSGGGTPLFGESHRKSFDDSLAQLKGEVRALDRAAQARHCALPPAPVAVKPPPSPPQPPAQPTTPAPHDDRAMQDLNRAIQRHPDDPAALITRGTAWSGRGEYDRAIQDFDAAIRRDPLAAPAFYNRAIAYYGNRQYDRALSDYEHAITLDPGLRTSPPTMSVR
jgi:hypothetical protein